MTILLTVTALLYVCPSGCLSISNRTSFSYKFVDYTRMLVSFSARYYVIRTIWWSSVGLLPLCSGGMWREMIRTIILNSNGGAAAPIFLWVSARAAKRHGGVTRRIVRNVTEIAIGSKVNPAQRYEYIKRCNVTITFVDHNLALKGFLVVPL